MTTPTMIKGRTKLIAHIQHSSWKESLVLQVSLGRELPQLLAEELVHSKLFLGSKYLLKSPSNYCKRKPEPVELGCKLSPQTLKPCLNSSLATTA